MLPCQQVLVNFLSIIREALENLLSTSRISSPYQGVFHLQGGEAAEIPVGGP